MPFALGAAGLAYCQAASADVLDVGADGAVTTYNAPGTFGTDGFHAISLLNKSVPPEIYRAPPATIGSLLAVAAARWAVEPGLLRTIAWNESRYRTDAVSRKGAVGIMQLMDGTARSLGVNRYDLSQNIFGGAAYIRQMLDRYGGNTSLALAAYNAGPGAVDHFGGIPPFRETRAYVRTVLKSSEPIHFPQQFVLSIDR